MIRPQAARRPQQHGNQCAVKWDRKLQPKLAIMRQCTSVTDRRTDGLASWHKREMYILHLALKMKCQVDDICQAYNGTKNIENVNVKENIIDLIKIRSKDVYAWAFRTKPSRIAYMSAQ